MLTTHLDDHEFHEIIKNTPLISIDLIISDGHGKYLLGLRKNQPAAGFWFVLGGRIKKDESIAEAFSRVSKDELGIDLNISSAQLHGVYEHFYDNCFFDDNTPTHYVVLAYLIELPQASKPSSLTQHSKYKWLDLCDVLSLADVHPYTKDYFKIS